MSRCDQMLFKSSRITLLTKSGLLLKAKVLLEMRLTTDNIKNVNIADLGYVINVKIAVFYDDLHLI